MVPMVGQFCKEQRFSYVAFICLSFLWIASTQVPDVAAKPQKEPKPAPFDKINNEAIDNGKQKQSNPKNSKNVDELVPDLFQPWVQRGCMPLKRLLNRKSFADRKLLATMDKISSDKSLSAAEKKFHLQTFRIFSQELNETESGVVESLRWLDMVLKGDIKNFANLQEKSLARLTYLKEAVLQEEREYQEILAAQESLGRLNQTHVAGLMEQILDDVAKAADELEELLNENLFKIAVKDGAGLETVVKLRSGEEAEGGGGEVGADADAAGAENDAEMVKLVDARDNQFVLAKGSDSTVPHEDHHLIQDVVHVFVTALVFGSLCSALRLPTMLGYIVAGVLLGPSMLNTIKSQVQIETLGEFGVFFILFVVGLEFSPAQLKKVFRVAVAGTVLMTGLMVLCGMGVGALLNTSANESVFVAACLSLSSTPLVVKFLSPSNPTDTDSPGNSDFGSVLLGILVMQDVLLGLIMAFLPILANKTAPDNALHGDHSAEHSGNNTDLLVTYLLLFCKLAVSLAVLGVVAVVGAKFVIGRLFSAALKRFPSEVILLLTVAVAFSMLVMTERLHVSMELGCFVAGVMVSAQAGEVTRGVERLVTPLRDFLAVLFFASIGLHVFPTFLAYQVTVLTTLTMATVGGKYVLSVAVLACLTRRAPAHIKWIVSAGLAQVSEFSFVLGSRARRLGLISREVYLLILSVTTLSLLLAPVLWKSTVWRLRIRLADTSPGQADSHPSPPTLSPRSEKPPSSLSDHPSPLMRRQIAAFTQP